MPALIPPRNSTIVLKRWVRERGLRARFALGGWLQPRRTLQRAADLFATPLATVRARACAADPAGAAHGEVEAADGRIATYLWGDPASEPVAVLAHGWSSYGLFLLPWVAPLRAAGYAVVAFDQAGHGRSDGSRSSLPAFAEVLGRVAARYGRPGVVIGHSLGGAATMLALAGGLSADRAVLIAPPADPFAAGERFARRIGLAGHLAARLFDDFQARTRTRVDSLQAHRVAPALTRPALIVHDLDDREVPWDEGERYARYWSGARLLTTTGLGHHRIVNAPAVIGDALRFLAGEAVGQRVVSSPDLPYGFF